MQCTKHVVCLVWLLVPFNLLSEALLIYDLTFEQIKKGKKSDAVDVTAGFQCRTINIIR